MKQRSSPRILALALASSCLLGAWAPQAHANVCGSAAFSPTLPAEASWRKDQTQPSNTGNYSATTPKREAEMKQASDKMADFILNYKGSFGVGDIPPMEFVPAADADVTFLSTSTGDNGIITRIKVSKAGKDAKVRGTLLLPVSGHNGNAAARKWAKTDTYDVRLDTNPKNSPATHGSWGATGKETPLISNGKSLDLVTTQEVEIPLQAGVPVVVLYYRHGSGGPGGYVEGRVMEFIWDGT